MPPKFASMYCNGKSLTISIKRDAKSKLKTQDNNLFLEKNVYYLEFLLGFLKSKFLNKLLFKIPRKYKINVKL